MNPVVGLSVVTKIQNKAWFPVFMPSKISPLLLYTRISLSVTFLELKSVDKKVSAEFLYLCDYLKLVSMDVISSLWYQTMVSIVYPI